MPGLKATLAFAFSFASGLIIVLTGFIAIPYTEPAVTKLTQFLLGLAILLYSAVFASNRYRVPRLTWSFLAVSILIGALLLRGLYGSLASLWTSPNPDAGVTVVIGATMTAEGKRVHALALREAGKSASERKILELMLEGSDPSAVLWDQREIWARSAALNAFYTVLILLFGMSALCAASAALGPSNHQKY